MRDEQPDARLAVALGYTQYKHYADTGEINAHLQLAQYVLPVDPFVRLGPYVIVRELILDRSGAIQRRSGGKERIRAKLRRLPFSR